MKKDFKEVDITVPKEGRVILMNRYWACVKGVPTKALYYGNSPQCNKNESIMKWTNDRLFTKEDNVHVVFVPIAYAL